HLPERYQPQQTPALLSAHALPGRRFSLAFSATLRNILLTIFIGQIIRPFLRIFLDQVDNPGNGPGDQAKQPQIAPETPGEEVSIQEDTRKDNWQADKADNRQPAKIAIQHILH